MYRVQTGENVKGGRGEGGGKEFVQMELMDDTTSAPIISNIEDIEIWPFEGGHFSLSSKVYKSVTTYRYSTNTTCCTTGSTANMHNYCIERV